MPFLKITEPEEASGAVRAMYDKVAQQHGFVPNWATAFSHRPKVLAAWSELLGSIRENMDPCRYELATLAAARALRSSYCMLAHGSVLARDFFDPAKVAAIAEDFRSAQLQDSDVAVMEFAEKVVRDAAAITQADVDKLHEHGLSDREIFDVAAAAAARCFLSKTVDALGIQADGKFASLDDELRGRLTIGRPIAGGEHQQS
ncbi:MAG: peroxidase-related enzyme [Arenicellales bacterium]